MQLVWQAMLLRRMSPRSEQVYLAWIRRYVRYHGLRHPRELGGPEIAAFLTHLAVERGVAGGGGAGGAEPSRPAGGAGAGLAGAGAGTGRCGGLALSCGTGWDAG
ncbi:MAG: site-specific integrase [Gemmatimonadales bacterium]